MGDSWKAGKRGSSSKPASSASIWGGSDRESKAKKQGRIYGLNRKQCPSELLLEVADRLSAFGGGHLYFLPWERDLPHHLLSRIHRDESCVCLIFLKGIFFAISWIRATKRGNKICYRTHSRVDSRYRTRLIDWFNWTDWSLPPPINKEWSSVLRCLV